MLGSWVRAPGGSQKRLSETEAFFVLHQKVPFLVQGCTGGGVWRQKVPFLVQGCTGGGVLRQKVPFLVQSCIGGGVWRQKVPFLMQSCSGGGVLRQKVPFLMQISRKIKEEPFEVRILPLVFQCSGRSGVLNLNQVPKA